MKRPPTTVAFVLLVAAAVLAGGANGRAHERQVGPKTDQEPIMVTLERVSGRLAHKLQPDPAPGTDVLRGLQILFGQLGPDFPVIGVIDASIKVVDIAAVSGLAGKAQFNNVYTFLLDRNSKQMIQVCFFGDQAISRKPTLSPPEKRRPIMLTVEAERGRVIYGIDANPAPDRDVLRGLKILARWRGADYPVVVLINQNVLVADLLRAQALARKANFTNPHTFILDYDLKRMTEVHFCTEQPISNTPRLDSGCGSTFFPIQN